MSYMVWLGATYGKLTGDWTYFKDAWDKTEQYIIPDPERDQPGVNSYIPTQPAQYAPEADSPKNIQHQRYQCTTGIDPLQTNLPQLTVQKLYIKCTGSWTLTTVRVRKSRDGTSRCSYINTYQRGSGESYGKQYPPSWKTLDGTSQQRRISKTFWKLRRACKAVALHLSLRCRCKTDSGNLLGLPLSKEQGKERNFSPILKKRQKWVII